MKTTLWLTISFIFMIMTACDLKKEENRVRKQDALENIFSRKSVRKFLPNPVEKEKLQLILKAGMAGPSGKNVQPWSFVVVDDRSLLDSLAAGLPYAKMLQEAPMAIVVCGDESQSSYWYLDCSAAAENILLAVEALGLGAVWTATYPYPERMDVVNRYIALPSQVRSLCVIPIGYPAKPYQPRDKWDETKVHYNKW